MHQLVLALAIMMGVLLALFNGLVGAQNARHATLSRTVWFALFLGGAGGLAFWGEFWFLFSNIADPALHITPQQGALVALMMLALSVMFMPFVMRSGYKVARNQVDTAKRMTSTALTNFDAWSEEVGSEKALTYASLSRTLQGNLSEDERKAVSYMRANLANIGHVVGMEGSYNITVDTKVREEFVQSAVIGISRADLNGHVGKVTEKRKGWVR